MNCGKNVRLNPTKTTIAANLAMNSGYMRPNIFGHQKWMPPRYAITIPPTMM